MSNTIKKITGLNHQGDKMNKDPSSSAAGSGGDGGNMLEIRVTRLEVKVDHIQSDITEIKANQQRMEDKFDAKFTSMEAKFDAKFGLVDAKFDKVDAKFDKVDAKFDKLFYWIIGTLITTIISVMVPIILFFIK